MKKRFELFKTAQLAMLVILAGMALYILFTDSALYQLVGRDPSIRALCLLLWLTLVVSFIGIYWDFSTHSAFKKDYRELDYAVYNDRLSGIANRCSCDAMIEKYLDQTVPDTLACVMLDILNIREINEQHGHLKGNETIQAFSGILHTASLGLCFVGRNGGNKFMALFEDCDESKLSTFLSRVQQQVNAYNAQPHMPRIEYRTGRALSRDERVGSITQLIALADRRLTLQMDRVTGLASRASCDDIIAQYLDKPLPQSIGCVMLDIANIREINAAHGHAAGNRVIRQFGDILREAAAGLCFVGRNGGTKFLALFEDCSAEKLQSFLSGVDERVTRINAQSDTPIVCLAGSAFDEGADIASINQLVALSDQRLSAKKESFFAEQEQCHGRA